MKQHENPHGIHKGMLILIRPHNKYRNGSPFVSKVLRIFGNCFWVKDTHGKFWMSDLSHYSMDYQAEVSEWLPCHEYHNTYKRECAPQMKGVHHECVEGSFRRIAGYPAWYFGRLKDRRDLGFVLPVKPIVNIGISRDFIRL